MAAKCGKKCDKYVHGGPGQNGYFCWDICAKESGHLEATHLCVVHKE